MSNGFGDVQRYIGGFPRSLMARIAVATRRNVALAERTVVMHLKNQDLRWKPLSPAYAERKALTGSGKRSYFRGTRRGKTVGARRRGGRLSEKTLIASAAMMESITGEVFSPYEGAVGIKRSAKHPGGGKAANIAAVHEFGSRDGKIPARPLWGPSVREIEDKCVQNWDKAIYDTVIRG